MRRTILAISLILTLLSLQTRAQQEQAQDRDTPPLRGSPRDVQAAQRALSEWWLDANQRRDQRLQWWRDATFGAPRETTSTRRRSRSSSS